MWPSLNRSQTQGARNIRNFVQKEFHQSDGYSRYGGVTQGNRHTD